MGIGRVGEGNLGYRVGGHPYLERDMTELHIQYFMRNTKGDAYGELLAQYGIKNKQHGEHPNLVLFKYDQIGSPFSEQIVRECRGIILDSQDDWRVVSRAFDKFFNHGEGHAAEIDWPSARVQEKVDGSICTLYAYEGKWHVATSGTPDASGEVNMRACTFAELFWKTFAEAGAELPHLDCAYCYYFELTSPLNRVVVPHSRASLTLLGARCLLTQREIGAHASCAFLGKIPTVREYPLDSFEAIAESFKAISPLTQEGYVVVDQYFRRVKVKHPGYVALHHAKDGMSRKSFVEIARSGETAEVVAAFPEFAELVGKAKAGLESLTTDLEVAFLRLKDIPEQKAFALEALKTPLSAALFAVRSGRTASIPAYLREMQVDRLADLLDEREAARVLREPSADAYATPFPRVLEGSFIL